MINSLRIPLLSAFTFIIVIAGCKKNHEEAENPPLLLNTFSMNVNGQFWEPPLIGGDSCFSKFSCQMSALNNSPYYTISASKDSIGAHDFTNQDYFRLQIMNVENTGVYPINDPSGDFKSYAQFIIYEVDGIRIIYETRRDNTTSEVTIEEFLPEKGMTLVGIKGSFTGTVYNMENPNDSIVIRDCKFVFNKINRSNYNQCQQ